MRGILKALVATAYWTGALAAAAEPVVLANGDVLDAVSVEQTEDGWVIEHAVLGTLALPVDAVAQVETDAAAPALPDVAAEPAGDPDPGVFGSGWLVDFDRSFSLGLAGASGNSENKDFTVGLDLDFEDERKRWNFDGRYYYSESDGSGTKNQGYIDFTRDWLLPNESHFYFGQLRWDVDRFEDWDHRGSVGGGVGWELVSREDFSFRARTGAAVTRTFGGTDDDTDLELLLRLETEWQPSEFQTITAYNTIYPSVTDTGEFRNLTGVTWKIALAAAKGLALQLGLENEYESDVVLGSKHNDLNYNASLGVDF
jgi:putative salt-induced outer membrane protein